MAKNDDATLIIGTGNFYTATVGTALPADLLAPEVAWVNVGNTSIEDIFGISSDGGDATTISTLQSKPLRTKFATRTETFTFTLQQFDLDSLKLYFGSNMVDTAGDGSLLGVPGDPTPTTAAFLAVFQDGENVFAFYAPKAEIFRQDDMSLSDTESLAGLPLGVTPLAYNANTWAYAITPLGSVSS